MSKSIEIIISQFERLSDTERKQITSGLTRHLGKPILISTSELSMYNNDEIDN